MIYQFAVADDGSLSPLGGVASVPISGDPGQIVGDPEAFYVLTASDAPSVVDEITQYATGALAPLSLATVQLQTALPSPAITFTLSLQPGGGVLYAMNGAVGPVDTGAGSVAQYLADGTGALSLVQAPYQLPASPLSPLVFDAAGDHAYYAGYGSLGPEVAQLTVAADGTLSPMDPAAVAATELPAAIALSPDGQSLYVVSTCVGSDCHSQIALYSVDAQGVLSATGATWATAAGDVPVALLLDEDGSHAYLVTSLATTTTNTGSIYPYTIEAGGMLNQDFGPTTISGQAVVGAAISGSNLYVISSNAAGTPGATTTGGAIDRYTLSSGGLPTAAGSTPLSPYSPTAMAVVTAAVVVPATGAQ